MIEGLKPYPDYKESGLPWLGRYPSHWVIKRGKSYMTCVDQRSKSGKEELLTVSSARGVVPRNTAKVTMFKAASYAGYKLCWPDDLVINSLWAWGGGLGVANHHGIISTAYSVYRVRPSAQIVPRFLHELVRSSAFNWELQVRSKGIWISRLQLTDTAFLDAPIPLPPPDEQAAIVRFLDHANRKIDGFIRAKRKLIGLLNEQKQAIIHRAVTRGLDPSVPLKPSGIPWLGDIPHHWEVRRMKNVGNTKIGLTYSPADVTDESGCLVLRASNIKNGKLVHADDVFVRKDIPPEVRVKSGDILICARSGSRNLVGKSAFITPEFEGVAFGAFMSVFRSPWNDFVFWVLNSNLFSFVMAQFETSTINQLTQGDLNTLVIPFPPRDEQLGIVKSVERQTSSLNTAIARTEREIALMQEYRTRLTADVVTGKLDVRPLSAVLAQAGAAAHLPELPGASEAAPDEDLTGEPEPEEAEA